MSETQPVTYQPVLVTERRPINGLGITAMILGICGFVVALIPLFIGLFLSFLPAILAVIFGIIGTAQAAKRGGAGYAITGLVIGSMTLLLYFLGLGTIW